MADTFTYNGTDGAYLIDFTAQIINCDIGMATLHVQDLVNACRSAEDSPVGMAYPKIINASGKEYLDTINGVQVAITSVLLDNWKVYSLKYSGVFKVMGGNLVQVSGGEVFEDNADLTYINYQSAAGTIVQVSSGGSGLSTTEHNQLMAIATELRLRGLLFDRSNTVVDKKIINYTAGGDVVVDVTYDVDGVPVSEVPR